MQRYRRDDVSLEVCASATLATALGHQPVHLFPSLLLHNMATQGDRIEQGSARGHETRTAPLWGLRDLPARRRRRHGQRPGVDPKR